MTTTAPPNRVLRGWLRPVVVVATAAALALGAAGCGDRSETLTVTHGPVPAPVLVDNGADGSSVGDVRLFHIPARSGGTTVITDWIMTTTATNSPEKGVEVRIVNAVFSFGGLDDTLVIEGKGWYPGGGAVLKPATTVQRAVIGGTGRFSGATGHVVSTHDPDDSWTHVVHLD